MKNVDDLGREKLTQEETYLIAPCGIYCGACDIFLGKSKNLATEMYRIVNGFNIADVGPVFMGIEQEKIVDFLNMLKTWSQLNKCPGCLAGGGNPSCPMRACSQQQGFLTCAECDKTPCYRAEHHIEGQPEGAAVFFELVTRRYANWNIGNLERIREVGYRQFVDEMQDKVKGGLLTSDVISSEMVVTEAMKKMKAED
jgi:hypothetical protein